VHAGYRLPAGRQEETQYTKMILKKIKVYNYGLTDYDYY
jgi:hypothetical protein